MPKYALFSFAFALAFLLAGCSGQDPAPAGSPEPADANALVIDHAQGRTTLPATPASVMVADWAAFDLLHALGVPVAGVPGGVVPGHLADKLPADAARIGSLQEPDIEAIAAARPDLMIVAARSRTAYPALARIVPTIDLSVDNNDVVAGVKANLDTLARIFDRQPRAAELTQALDRKIAQAREAVRGRGTGLVIVTHGGRMGIYGPGSRVSWLYSELGIPSVFDDVDDRDHGGDAITFEYLVKTDPDWLLVIDRDAGIGNEGAARALLDNALVHQTGFWRNGRIIHLDPAASYVTMHGHDALMRLLDQVIDGYSKP